MKIAIIKAEIKTGTIETVKRSLREQISEDLFVKGFLAKSGDSYLIIMSPIKSMKELSSLLYYKIHKMKDVKNTFTKIATIKDSDFSEIKSYDFLTFVHCKKNDVFDDEKLYKSLVNDMRCKPFVAKIDEQEFYLIYNLANDFSEFDINNTAVIRNLNNMGIKNPGMGHDL